MATHIFVFFPLCKLKILPTLRPCNFKSKSQCCLEKEEKSAKTVMLGNPLRKLSLPYVTHCLVSEVLFHAKRQAWKCFLEQLQPSASVSSFFADHMI